MRRRHLESVSSRSLSVRGSWGTAPSVFWHGAPGGTQGPLGKGGAAERWGVAYPIGIATRHGAKPATPRTHKRNAPPARRTGRHPAVTPRRRQATTNYPSPGRRTVYAFAKGPAARPPTNQPNKIHKSPTCKNPLRVCVRAGPCRGVCTWARVRLSLKNFLPKAPAKTAPVPREAPAKNRKIKIFQKNLPKQAGICRPDCVLY